MKRSTASARSDFAFQSMPLRVLFAAALRIEIATAPSTFYYDRRRPFRREVQDGAEAFIEAYSEHGEL
jgi:hypothetical protein